MKWNAKQHYYENGVFLIVCVDCGEDVPWIYTSEGFYYGPNIEKDLFHLDLVIVTDEPDEHPQITMLKEHLSFLSEEDRHKEWQRLQEWYNEHFKPEHRDWVEEFRKDIEGMSQEEFDEKWNEIKRRCGEDNEEDKTKELTDFEYAVLSVISDHNKHTDSIEDFARRNAKNLLSIAYKQFEKELPKWKKNGNSFGGNGYNDIYLISALSGSYPWQTAYAS